MKRNPNQNIKIIFFGTPEFSVSALKALINSGYQIQAVVCRPDKPAGRKHILTPPPVKILAQKHNIPVLQPEKLRDPGFTPTPREVWGFIKKINDLDADLAVVSAYGKLIPDEIIYTPKFKSINIHPSLLPKYRGASPIQGAILNGDKETGVTIMIISDRMDAGDILSQEKIELSGKETSEELFLKLAKIGAELLIKTIPDYISKKIKSKPQDDAEATYTKIIKKEDGEVDFKKETAEEIERKVRAFWPWPSAYAKLKTQESRIMSLKILKVSVMKCVDNKNTGEMFLTENKKLAIKCKKGCLILEIVQPEGKKIMEGLQFWNGYAKSYKVIKFTKLKFVL